ncbi:hypothetical protein [Ochrobactrum sp. A-1]|uniref:hypothetical protein n=1 Tax=Ochrobactrum sp. A-1 TaxID=2920940 RepID=UPI001F0A7A26|nr:hypothetical protein [Ochrobactrum sp. A-1]
METTLRNICAENGLSAISTTVFTSKGFNRVAVYVHWVDNEGTWLCESGIAKTLDDALSLALAEKSKIVSEAA